MADQKLRTRAVPAEWVEIAHDGIDGTATVAPESVPHWEERGWKPVADKSKKSPAPRAATGSES